MWSTGLVQLSSQFLDDGNVQRTSVCDYCSHTLVFFTAKKFDRGTSFRWIATPV